MAKQNPYKRLNALLSSPKFFWGILALFTLQAAWIALSGRYPMAFDEDFHLGIIRLYAHHASPFWSAQSPGADAFGAVFRDPSYLYQWLMSFPYRFISLFTHDTTVQVLWLRAINIGLFAAGLALFRRLLLKTGASRPIIHLCLLLFVLIPVVPLLAAQINYDNLFMPLMALLLLLVVRFDEQLKGKGRINEGLLGVILIICLFGSLIKYAFLPIALAIGIYLVFRMWQVLRSPRKIARAKLEDIRKLGMRGGLLLGAGVIIAGGLFIERYGVNTVKYHSPIPDCAKVLSVEACSAYGPWIRDHNLELWRAADAPRSPAIFAADWFYGMWLRMFFAVDGPGTGFQTRGPLIIPAVGAIVFAVSGAVLSLVYAKRLFRKYDAAVWALIFTVSGIYVAALWFDGYKTFLHTGVAVAINGRYLFPVLLPLMLFGALAFKELLGHRENLKALLAAAAVLTMLWGGGVLTYILRSNDRWYWPQTPLARANHTIQNDLGPFVPGYRDPITFMHRR